MILRSARGDTLSKTARNFVSLNTGKDHGEFTRPQGQIPRGLETCNWPLYIITYVFQTARFCKSDVYNHAHCNENTINVFLYWELRGLSPNFHIHVSVSDLYIPRIGPNIWLQQNRQTNPGNTVYKSLTDIWGYRNWETEHYNSVLEIRRLHRISGNT